MLKILMAAPMPQRNIKVTFVNDTVFQMRRYGTVFRHDHPNIGTGLQNT
jgi:hypothetical protein